jgi:hypothetical protein
MTAERPLPSTGERLAALALASAPIALLGSLFMHWRQPRPLIGGGAASGWHAFPLACALLATAGLAAFATAALLGMGRTPPRAWFGAVAVAALGGVGFCVVCLARSAGREVYVLRGYGHTVSAPALETLRPAPHGPGTVVAVLALGVLALAAGAAARRPAT